MRMPKGQKKERDGQKAAVVKICYDKYFGRKIYGELKMKKYMSLVSVPAVNIGAFLYAQIPAFGMIEEIFKILVLAASFVFTVFRIIGMVRKKR